MKKLSLLLLAICVSLAGWAQTTLNPYAYDLQSSWDAASRKLTISFKLNTKPNIDTSGDRGGAGIMVRLVDSKGNRYNIVPVSLADINSKVCGPYTYTIDFASGKDPYGNSLPEIPADEYLTWEVRVCGEDRDSNSGRKVVATSDIQNAGWRPYSTHGVAIGKNYNNPNYGKIFVTESSASKPSGWDWLEGKIPSLLEYNPMKFTSTVTSDYATAHKKTRQNSSSSAVDNFSNPEPHRVRISDDGRIFVTSYHYNSTTSVWEYVGNGQFNQLILHDKGAQNRIVAMDVKGSGPNLKLLLCEIIPNKSTYSNGQKHGQLIIREYSIGTSTTTHTVGSGTPLAYYNDYRTNTGNSYAGLLYQSFNGQQWSLYSDGLINIAYGKGDAIWLKVDFYISKTTKSRIIYFDGTTTGETYKDEKGDDAAPTPPKGIRVTPLPVISGGYGGGDGLLVKGDTLITAGTDRIYFYPINADGSLGNRTELNTVKNDFHSTLNWVNDFALDPAQNLYAVSSSARNIIAIPLPYDGVVTTPAPDNTRFILSDPVPNILATDLRLNVNNANEYTFSFNTNTKPEEAQIRFYSSYDAMKNSLNAVNADNYDGTNNNKPVYVYNIPDDKLKQGRIAVNLGAVGGQVDANGVITNDRLPAGVLYWSVYVKTRKSNVFAPTCRLEGINDAQGAHRRYATVNNYPETDMFGSFIVADNPAGDDVNGGYHGLMIYGINPEGNSNDEQSDISNDVRYSHRESYLNSGVASASDKLNFPRRLVVAPDGRVFIADQGTTDVADYAGATSIVQHERGGVRLWDPKDPNKFTLFSHNKIGTSFGVSLWEHPAANGGLKIYASNAYEEYLKHNTTNNYTDDQKKGIFGWNGFAEYTLEAHPSGSANWSNPDSVHYALGRGDASGNYSLVAMDKGVWMCQHREHNRQLKDEALQPLADNLDAVLISFFPYGSTKAETWNSCTSNGVNNYNDATKRAERDDASDLTQKKSSPVQSTPGAGMAYRKIDGKEYLFVVNHDGNIAQILIDGWTGSGVTATPIIDASKVKILVTPAYTKGDRDVSGTSTKWHTAFITTINFDYAGNLVTTTGKNFGQAHDIIVYTMPYDRTNAREIQAPNSCRMIPERLAYLDMSAQELELVIKNHKDHDGCAIELFRPLQAGMFNTICLPFELNFANLPSDHPLKNADVRAFTGATLENVGGEKVLSLVFSDITSGGDKVMTANVPYLLQPVADIAGSMRFDTPVKLTSIEGSTVGYDFDTDNRITFKGVIPITSLEANPLTLLLVANNRLAELSSNTNILGFRGYFQLTKELEPGTATRIVGKKPVATNTTIVVDGKKVNVEKYLREGRVYIRVDETLYTIDGVKVE